MVIKKTLKRIVIIGLILLIIMLLPFTKLLFTEAKVTKALLFDYYFVKVTSDEYEFSIFEQYMAEKGWTEVDQLGGLHVFERDGVYKNITNTQVKTIIKNGKLNLEYLNRYFD